MIIGFDAKRLYQNTTGLGNYSRMLVSELASNFPDNHYILFAPKKTALHDADAFQNVKTITPAQWIYKKLKSLWRSKGILKDIKKEGTEIFHGLSAELPFGIANSGVKSVVTIHDLIFERYPDQYNSIDVKTYRAKAKYACKVADKILAVSEQTKQDLIQFYGVDAEKIIVSYQHCNTAFETKHTDSEKEVIRSKYNLPKKYFLYVGTIIERKNLLVICRAIKRLAGKIDIPLVVIGGDSSYRQKVDQYISENNLADKIIFLRDSEEVNNSKDFRSGKDFPAIYQMAAAFIYPSVFEGFGLPVLEALWSGTPTITTNVSCMPETGGDAALYILPDDDVMLAQHLTNIVQDKILANQMRQKGFAHAEKFSPAAIAKKVMSVYETL